MSSHTPDPDAGDPTTIAACYEQACSALADGDITRVLELLDAVDLPTARPTDLDPAAWRAVESAHRRLHEALAADLGDAQRELAELRRGQQVLRRMAGR